MRVTLRIKYVMSLKSLFLLQSTCTLYYTPVFMSSFLPAYQGNYDEAEKLNRQALEGREKELGVQHPDTLTSVSNLADVLQDQRKYDEAEKLKSRRALEGREKELGAHHPRYADEREQPGGCSARSGEVRRSREAEPAGARRDGEGTWSTSPRYADEREQPGGCSARSGGKVRRSRRS